MVVSLVVRLWYELGFPSLVIAGDLACRTAARGNIKLDCETAHMKNVVDEIFLFIYDFYTLFCGFDPILHSKQLLRRRVLISILLFCRLDLLLKRFLLLRKLLVILQLLQV